jgi:protease I
MAKRAAMVLARNFEDVEATDPKQFLEDHGVDVTVIGLDDKPITGKKGATIEPDTTFDKLASNVGESFDLLVIPGGGSPENLRIDDQAVEFTRKFMQSGKPVAAICHGPQLLISADVLDGRTLTSVNKVRDDVKNAGGNYVDKEVVVDGNLITSRTPDDLPAFDKAMAQALDLDVNR